MGKISYTNIDGMRIEGIEGDYVFETIREKNNFYENVILDKWKKYLNGCKVIFDVGANLGNHTLFWARKLNPEAIYSFEPYEPNYERLLHNVQNNLLENVYPINKAVGRKEGYTSVKEFHEDNYGGTTLNVDIQSEGEIEVISIDSFIKENNLENVDFIKIDTEGYEVSVLDGAIKTISKYCPDLWIEVNSQSFQEIMNRLEQFGYIVVDVIGFNMLFLNQRKHAEIEKIDFGLVWKIMFDNLEKADLYYKNYLTAKNWNDGNSKKADLYYQNYLTAKSWNEAKEQKLQLASAKEKALNEELDNSKQKYKRVLEDYNNQKKKEKKFVEEMLKCLKDYDLMAERTEQLFRRNTKLEAQNGILILENKELKRQLDIIINSRIGRMGIKAYQVYKKLRGR